jgi:hypothetical protein
MSKLIKAPRAYTTHGTDLFGDAVNLYNGGLSFIQTDVSLRGNSQLPVSVGRRISAGQQINGGKAFGFWELDIPHIHGIFSTRRMWQGQDGSENRCSAFGAPPMVTGTNGFSDWDASEF